MKITNYKSQIINKITGKNQSFPPTPSLQTTSGFTIVETLVSLAIFSVSVIGLIAVTTQGSIDAKYYKKKITASYLAQQNLENIRNIRDTATLSGASSLPWADFKNTVSVCVPTAQRSGCLPVSPTNLRSCPSDQKGCELYDSYGGYTSYVFMSGVPLAFYSVVQVVDMGDSVKVISTVSWGTDSSVTMSENLFDWQ